MEEKLDNEINRTYEKMDCHLYNDKNYGNEADSGEWIKFLERL